MYAEIDLSETDVFNRLENIGMQKLYIQQNHPEIFDFLKSINEESAEEVKPYIEENINLIYKHGNEKIYSGIDYSKFRDDIDINKAIEILNWTMYGFGEKRFIKSIRLKIFLNLEISTLMNGKYTLKY